MASVGRRGARAVGSARRGGDRRAYTIGPVVDDLQVMHAPGEALALLLARCRALPAEGVPVSPGRVGRVTAEAVHAVHDLPPFPSSAMDGYALRAAEAGGPLPLAG